MLLVLLVLVEATDAVHSLGLVVNPCTDCLLIERSSDFGEKLASLTGCSCDFNLS